MNAHDLKTAAISAVTALVVAGAVAFVVAGSLGGGALKSAAVEKITHDYLLSHPEIISDLQNALDAKQEAADQKARHDALARVGTAALVDPKVAYVIGPATAKVTVAEFFDYRCPYCKASQAAVQKALKDHPDVRFAFVEYPILTQDSIVAARAAVAARRQPGKYLPFHNALMATTGALPKERILAIAKDVGIDVPKLEKDMDDPAVAASLKASHALADRLKVNGTPTFVVGDQIIVGQMTNDDLTTLIKDAKS